MWTDNETNEDLLGFSIHTNLLQSIITNSDMLPVTVGLFGDWGGGKSSILRMLEHNLKQDEQYAVIYFNSWVFEGYDDAKTAILTSLLTELREHRRLKDTIGDEAKELLQRVNWMKFLRLGVSAGASIAAANPLPLMFSGLLSSLQGESDISTDTISNLNYSDLVMEAQNSVESIRSFRQDFQGLINKTDLDALIILIDDLDRCSPERLIENLEAIKLFLNVENTAFIVAADRRIVENAIRIRYSDLYSGDTRSTARESLVNDYLEKLIQVPYTLPKLAPHEVRSYMYLLFLKKHLEVSDFEEVLGEYDKFLKGERYKAFQLGDEVNKIEDEDVRKTVLDSLRLVESCSDAITDGLKGNPRQIKRFLNAFWLRRKLAKMSQLSNLKDHYLIKLMVLEYISSERFEDIYQWHRSSTDGTAKPLRELEPLDSRNEIPEEYSKWDTPRLWKWLQAEPPLVDVDLRDYFWVARSAITDTLSGVRLMTQTMKTCVEELLSSMEKERQAGVELFNSLTEDEQESVLDVINKQVLQNSDNETPLNSLLELATNGHANAANTLTHCIHRIEPENIKAGFGVMLRNFEGEPDNKASSIIENLRDELAETNTKVGRTIRSKKRR